MQINHLFYLNRISSRKISSNSLKRQRNYRNSILVSIEPNPKINQKNSKD